MKIALLVPGGVDRSGTHRVIPCILWLIERLVAAGDEVHVFAFRQEARPGTWPLLGATVHNAGSAPRRSRMLAQLVAEHRRAPFDILHPLWAIPQGLVAALAGRLLDVPVVLGLPGGDLAVHPDIGYGGMLKWRSRLMTRLALKGADRIVVPSDFLRDQALACGVDAIRIPFGVALDRWPVRTAVRRSPGSPLRLLHVASLNAVKDQPMLLRAAAALRDQDVDFRLDIIGEDTLGGAIQRLAATLDLDRLVRFHGFIPHADLRPWMEQADLLLVGSRHEAGPIVTLEAALVGVPTVGTAVGHIADWSPEAAIAVPVGDSAALARAVARLAADEEERLRLAMSAQQRAIAEDADVTAIRTRALYRALVRPPVGIG
jgi:glycosyltransferase involved in cell wall biosynthesis